MARISNTKGLLTKIRTQIRNNVGAAAVHMQREFKIAVNNKGSGRIYITKKGRKKAKAHQASAPGDPPAKELGDLGRSIQVDRTEIQSLKARVGTPFEYGFFLEYGTSRMAARPWFTPTIRTQQDAIAAIMARGFKK
jgi:hypothetical protein